MNGRSLGSRAGLGALVVVSHLGFGALLLWLLHDRPWIFLAVEAGLVVSLVVQLAWLRRLGAPTRMLADATDLLESSDFATRLRPVGLPALDRLVEVYNRMADRLREERLAASERDQLLHGIEQASPVAMIALDHDGRVARLNPQAEMLLRIREDEARGHSLAALPGELAGRIDRVGTGPGEILHVDGRRRVRVRRLSFLDRGFPRSFVLVDELTDELRRSEKEAYGKLIRMMAHEVNNTTGAVGSLLESCRHYADQLRHDDRQDFESALDVAMRRTRNMNEFMRAFADVVRLGPPSKRAVDLDAMLEDLRLLLRGQLLERRIEWVCRADGGPGRVEADPVQLEQALLNVLRNAVQAIGEEGTIEIVRRHDGRRSVLEIFDDGEGIDDERARHLFTPFYTTRADGQGIGLILVQEILLGHGFDFSLAPHEGRTRFRIEFGPDSPVAVPAGPSVEM